MQVTLELPEDLARRIAADVSALSRAALEALALEGVRSGNSRRLRRAACWESSRGTRWMVF